MWLHDAECRRVLGHRADAKIRVGPHHRMTDHGVHVVNYAYQSLGRDDRAELLYASTRARAQGHTEFIADTAAMQRFRRDEPPLETTAKPQEIAQPNIFRFQ